MSLYFYLKFVWELKYENGYLTVIKGKGIKREIDLKDLVRVEIHESTYDSSSAEKIHSIKTITWSLRIEFISKDCIKVIDLPYNQKIRDRYIVETEEKINFASEYKALQFEKFFLTRKQIENEPKLNDDAEYYTIRSDEQNKFVEELIEKEIKKPEFGIK